MEELKNLNEPQENKIPDEIQDEVMDEEGEETAQTDDEAERTLSMFAVFMIVIGFLVAALFIVAAFKADNFMMFVFAGLSILGGIYSWALLKVFVNISMTLKEIKNKIE